MDQPLYLPTSGPTSTHTHTHITYRITNMWLTWPGRAGGSGDGGVDGGGEFGTFYA